MPRYRIEVSKIEADINRRFFKAVEVLTDTGKIHSLESFCNEAGLNSSRYREMRFVYGTAPKADKISRYKSIEVEGLYCLCKKYAVSAEWLLLGYGKMTEQAKN
jgi:DNA polymerase/3'-5' exonuclease PolX